MNIHQKSFLYAALSAAFLVAACGEKFPPDSPEYVVQSLYKASASRGIPRDAAKLSEFFDGRLTELLLKDFSCVSQGEPCGLLDFDPVAQSRKPAISSLEVFRPEDANEVFVFFKQRGSEYKAICVMVRTAAGWRISDIIYYGANQILEPGASILTHLSLESKPPAPWHPPVPGLSEDALEQLHL